MMRDQKESEDNTMFDIRKNEKKLKKLQKLENGRRQFRAIPRPLTTYVFVNNVSVAVALAD